MQTLSVMAFISLCALSFLSSALAKQCKETQYSWPAGSQSLCCDKCPPGSYVTKRTEGSCGICGACGSDRYTDTYNEYLRCHICTFCTKSHMEYKTHCSATHNAVCKCKVGYRCTDPKCTQCLPVSSTHTPSSSSSSSSSTGLKPLIFTTAKPFIISTKAPGVPLNKSEGTRVSPEEGDVTQMETTCLLWIIALLGVGIILVVSTKIKAFLRWVTSKQGYVLADKNAPVPPSSDDEKVSRPVQEMCGKCDQPIDV